MQGWDLRRRRVMTRFSTFRFPSYPCTYSKWAVTSFIVTFHLAHSRPFLLFASSIQIPSSSFASFRFLRYVFLYSPLLRCVIYTNPHKYEDLRPMIHLLLTII